MLRLLWSSMFVLWAINFILKASEVEIFRIGAYLRSLHFLAGYMQFPLLLFLNFCIVVNFGFGLLVLGWDWVLWIEFAHLEILNITWIISRWGGIEGIQVGGLLPLRGVEYKISGIPMDFASYRLLHTIKFNIRTCSNNIRLQIK